MDTLKSYAAIVKSALQNHVSLCQKGQNNIGLSDNITTFLVADDLQGNYIWMTVGWQQGQRVCGITVYIRIHQNKVWIEEDCTEDGIATDLIKAGISPDQIVLGFHPPQLRQYTEFAMA
jgi:hypothetical protein